MFCFCVMVSGNSTIASAVSFSIRSILVACCIISLRWNGNGRLGHRPFVMLVRISGVLKPFVANLYLHKQRRRKQFKSFRGQKTIVLFCCFFVRDGHSTHKISQPLLSVKTQYNFLNTSTYIVLCAMMVSFTSLRTFFQNL